MNSIGDFAQSLILQQVDDIKSGKELPPVLQEAKDVAPAGRDISNIEVPETFHKQVLEQFHPQDTPPVDSIPELVWEEEPEVKEPKTPEVLTEGTAQQLIPLLEEVKGLLKELTSCGSLGVNLAGPAPDPMRSLPKGYKSTKPSRRDILKKSIRNRLKK
jgi:hypothetical protein